MDLIETLNTRTHNNILQEYYFTEEHGENGISDEKYDASI